MKKLNLIVALCITALAYSQQIDTGIEIIKFKSPVTSSIGNSIITVVRINPKYYDFTIRSEQTGYHTAEEWSKIEGFLAVINPGMYHFNSQNLGYMKHYDNIYNPKLNKDNAILAMNPKDDSVPLVQIIDREYQDWNVLKNKYHTFTQSIRMVDLKGKNKWALRNSKWSMSVVAMDKDDNVLFIHCRSPYRVNTFINILLQAPLNIRNMMYLEGGPEASLYLNHNGTVIKEIGSYETNFYEFNDNDNYWKIPNIIGIKKKYK